MNNHDWQRERTRFERNVAELAIDAQPVLSNASGSILMARASFSEFEGAFQLTPRLMISLCLSGSGRLRRSTEHGAVEGVMRPGSFALALPNTQGSGFTPAADMLGLSIGSAELESFGLLAAEDLIPAASAIRNDPLISSVMRAIWLDAEANGMSSLFFQHGVALILKRLTDMQSAALPDTVSRPLPLQRLAHIREMIDARLGDDLNVGDLAREARLDVRSFTRAFRSATGLAPYEYLTMRRLERARELLQTERSITEIAMSVGYANPSKFAAAFRRLYDCSPREWRNAKR
ncbi:helix-turn-helix domain-containing protein [Tardiphaga sp.]|jgi:AraC family transcriptional regulator|uniref:AraC family transcriptional regulator n=1 Tax=Tardiphaga sp. TaxID=1926292 RepID=UPI0037DA5234